MSEEKRNIDKMLIEMFPSDPEIAKCFIGILDVISGPVPPKGPKLIQGYTAEQWQEIIDGGYLCEVSQFTDFVSFHMSPIKELRDGTNHNFVITRLINSATCYANCRPAQIKGVMRPIFVEPVDKETHCIFVNDNDGAVSGCSKWSSFSKLRANGNWGSITKYIEV